jgi:DNA polymerase I-like protein with 3'-5' exonuclease and polymerase domains
MAATRARRSRARELESRGQVTLGFSPEEMTHITPSTWQLSDLASLPDRLEGDTIGVDTETDDEGLRNDQGPGWAWRGGGRVVGYSVSADNCKVYLPVGHVCDNLDHGQVKSWLNKVLSDAKQTKVFANAMYDIGWMHNEGVEIQGPVIDIQIVEALCDEHRFSYKLDDIAKVRLGRGKDETLLLEAGRAYGVGNTIQEIKSNIYKLPPRYTGPYAEEDAALARGIWGVQEEIVEEENLGVVLKLEHDLLPMYLDMRRRGVRIDVSFVEEMRERLLREVSELSQEIKRIVGYEVSVWEARSVAKVLDDLGVCYGVTPRSREPQITNEVLDNNIPVCGLILQARQKEKLCNTFLTGQLLEQIHEGRVHGEIHPLRSTSDDGRKHGTISGRLSMSRPNLQNIPSRSAEGKLIRKAFLPEEGERWYKKDMSQQEMRLLVHYGARSGMRSAIEAAQLYQKDPTLNYHRFVAEVTGLELSLGKALNFAIIYGRGTKETAQELGISEEEAKELFATHARKMPFARQMSEACKDRVNARGFLTTLLGRRQRFPLWEPHSWDMRDGSMLPIEEARARWGGTRLTRARIHKALNSLIQPSAADQTKKCMSEVWKAGLGKYVMLQVHDELDSSAADEKTPLEIKAIMENAVKLEVPVVASMSSGTDWGSCE